MSLFILFIISLLLSAFFSGTEMAFVSVNEFKLRELADSGNGAARRIVKLKENPQQFLTAVLIGNNIVNITAAAIMTYWISVSFGFQTEWLATAIMVPIMVVVGELVPKDYCRMHGQSVLLGSSTGLGVFVGLFKWPSKLILKGTNLVLDLLGVSRDKSIFVSENEFRLLIEEGTQSGVIEKHEKQLIDMILDFERLKVASVMIPVEKAAKVSLSGTVGEVKKIAREAHCRMVLVYEEIPSIIVGMVYVFDLLFEEDEDQHLKNFLRSPIFISDQTSLEKAFLTLQQRRQSYAAVTDALGDVQGVVPIEKLLAV